MTNKVIEFIHVEHISHAGGKAELGRGKCRLEWGVPLDAGRYKSYHQKAQLYDSFTIVSLEWIVYMFFDSLEQFGTTFCLHMQQVAIVKHSLASPQKLDTVKIQFL